MASGVYEVRKRIGAELAREAPADADMVIPVPDSGMPAAIGFAEAAGLPFELGIIRNHYVGRTFIEPSDAIRHMGVRLKHNANRAGARGQARRAGRRFDRARHDLPEDRADGARRRRGGSAYAHRQPADDAFLLLRRRHARAVEAARRAHVGRGDAPPSSRSTASPSLDRRALPRGRRGASATAARRNSATPASPATIRPA